MAAFEQETIRTRPESLPTQMAKVEQQITRGTENLLLLAPADLPAASSMLAQWRTKRDQLQNELNDAEQTKPAMFDADAILAERMELVQPKHGCGWISIAKS